MADNLDLFAGLDKSAADKKRKPSRKAAPKAARKTPRASGRRPKANAPAAQPAPPANGDYTAHDIEILEGLEPVRRRPGMYVGGTDQRALHHLLAELIDNAMDEAIAGHASRIEIALHGDGAASVKDNGRGIPVDPHPKYENVSALQVILTTLHSGGKFGDKVYATSGGLHGVGLSVVNALSEQLTVEVARDKRLWRQSYARGLPAGPLEDAGPVTNRRGTLVRFHSDTEIFGEGVRFGPRALYEMARTRAYLYRGVEIRWSCDAALLADAGAVPETAVLHYPGGLVDYLNATLGKRHTLTPAPFAGQGALNGDSGRIEWAVAWPEDEDGFVASHCNTVPTSQGGSHESGMRGALVRGLKGYGALVGNKRAAQLTADDVTGGACALLSVFLRDPQFQGQTKERLASPEAGRLVENALGDHFDHWLSADPSAANLLLERVVERAEERLRRRKDREVARKRAARKTRLPGKLADCAREAAAGTEIFLVEGDSAGGSAKQARKPRNSGRAAATRQDPQRGERQRRQAARQQGARRSCPGAGLRHRRALRRGRAPLRARRHHDRCGRGRRPHRRTPDDLLLPPDAGDSSTPGTSSWRSRRSIAWRGAAPHAMRATMPTASGCLRATFPAPARSRSAASRGSAKCRRPSSRRPPWTPRGARCCASRSPRTQAPPRRAGSRS